MADEHGNEEQEGFGQASLGEAQSSDPPSDPEMTDGDGDDSEVGADPPIETEDADEPEPGDSHGQAEG